MLEVPWWVRGRVLDWHLGLLGPKEWRLTGTVGMGADAINGLGLGLHFLHSACPYSPQLPPGLLQH